RRPRWKGIQLARLRRAALGDRSPLRRTGRRRPGPTPGRRSTMNTVPIVSPEEWRAASERLLVKEKELTRARDALAAERRRMPWQAAEKQYEFDGPDGQASLLDLFEGRRQLIVYRFLGRTSPPMPVRATPTRNGPASAAPSSPTRWRTSRT